MALSAEPRPALWVCVTDPAVAVTALQINKIRKFPPSEP